MSAWRELNTKYRNILKTAQMAIVLATYPLEVMASIGIYDWIGLNRSLPIKDQAGGLLYFLAFSVSLVSWIFGALFLATTFLAFFELRRGRLTAEEFRQAMRFSYPAQWKE